VRWTRPFLPQLTPLTQEAARQTFIDITDDVHGKVAMDEILSLTGNLPLAIDLISHLVASDGFNNVMSRWEVERTSIVSEGFDRRSNLDLSISLSLSSPRITALPHSQNLLSLLSTLPDGLSNAELSQIGAPIDNFLGCRAALLRTSLAYIDDHGRLKALVPIREYLRKYHPPTPDLTGPLLTYFKEHLTLYRRYRNTASVPEVVARLTGNLGNIQSVLLLGLQRNNPDLVDTIECTLTFAGFCKISGRAWPTLMDRIPDLLPRPTDHRLEALFIAETFSQWTTHRIPDPKALLDRVLQHFEHLNEPSLQCKCAHSAISPKTDITRSFLPQRGKILSVPQ
jgi:hypothetical protein